MPKNRKSSSSDSDSGPDDRAPPPKKQATSSKNKSNNDEEEQGWHLGNNRFVKVREFHGKVLIDFREFYEKDGKMLPGKKGIALNTSQWNKFKNLIDDIDKKISEH